MSLLEVGSDGQAYPKEPQGRNAFNEHALAYFISNLAYKHPSERAGLLRKHVGDAYSIHPSFNDDEMVVVHSNDGNGPVYIGHRGTKTKDDLQTDVWLALNQLEYTDRYKNSLEKSRQVKEWAGNYRPVIEVGHSLGGTLAEKIAHQVGNTSVVFNPGTTPLAPTQAIDRSRHISFRLEGDLISMFDQSKGIQTLTPTQTTTGNSFLDQFTDKTNKLPNSVVGNVLRRKRRLDAGPVVAGIHAYFNHLLSSFQ